MKTAAQEKAIAAWGDNAPAWILALANECDNTSQKKTADRIGYSAAVVNTVLGRTYKGDFNAVEKAVKGALQAEKVMCPVAGELPGHRCQEYQRQTFSATNSMRVKLYQACRNGCPHSRHTKREQ